MPFEVPGLLAAVAGHRVLVFGPEADALAPPVLGPPVYLWPGYRIWGEPRHLVPHTVIDDVGREFAGIEVYSWLEVRGDLYPRSDVLGYLSDGGDRGLVAKGLDLADMAVFASQGQSGGPFLKIELAIEARAVPDGLALAPADLPVPALARALPCYRLAPGAFGAVGAAILNQVLSSGRRDWRLTFDELDEMMGGL